MGEEKNNKILYVDDDLDVNPRVIVDLEAGDRTLVTAGGRPVAQLGPIEPTGQHRATASWWRRRSVGWSPPKRMPR